MAVAESQSAAEVSGIAKKIAVELEQYPMETHQAVVSIVAQLFQHRGLSEQNRLQREQAAKQEAREEADRLQTERLRKHHEQLAAREMVTQ